MSSAEPEQKMVEVDQEVFALVQAEARPLIDTFNSALRRKLGLDHADRLQSRRHRPGRDATSDRRVPPGSILAESEYEIPLLEALVAAGGRAAAAEVTDAVGEALKDRFTEADREPHKSGDIRWRNRTAFTRLRLKEHGFLASGSPRGTWEITPEGREHLSKLQSAAASASGRRPRVGTGRSVDGRSAAEVTAEPIAHTPA